MYRGCNHTNTARCNVGSNHDGALASLELVQNPVTLVLLFVTVDGKCWPSVLAKESCDFVGNTLRSSEDEYLVVLVFHDALKMLERTITFLEVRNDLDDLRDAVVGGKIVRSNVDLNPILLVVGSQLSHLLRPSCRPHAGLSIRSNLTDDLSNLGLETHIKHTIGLVENKVSDTAKVSLARFKHVDQTTGSGNAHFDTSCEVTNLATSRHTTVHASVSYPRRLAEFADFLLNLHGKLTSRGEDEDDRAIALREERLSVDVDDGGKTVSEGLSRASLGNTDNISTRKSHGPALRLNCSGLGEALSLNFADDIVRESRLVECLDRLGYISALYGDLVGLAKLVDLRLRASGDCRVLLVERLFKLGKSAEVPVLLFQASTKVGHAIAAAAVATAARVPSSVSAAAAISVSVTVAIGQAMSAQETTNTKII